MELTSMRKSKSLGWVLIPALIAAFAVTDNPVKAGTIVYTFTGSNLEHNAVDIEADLTFGSGTLTIMLKNLEKNLLADDQEINGLKFKVGGLTGNGALLTSNSGLITTINTGTGAYTAGVADSLTRWDANHTGSAVTLSALSGGKPNRLIIGPDSLGNIDPTLGGLYSNANSSVSTHNPNVLGSATFVLTIAGANTDSTLSNVNFLIGTSTESVVGQLKTVPEPSSLAMASIAALAACGHMVYRRRRAV